jgi:hypothetical protein
MVNMSFAADKGWSTVNAELSRAQVVLGHVIQKQIFAFEQESAS